jgi:hypothetical protein
MYRDLIFEPSSKHLSDRTSCGYSQRHQPRHGAGGESFANMRDNAENGVIAFCQDDSLGAIPASESILDLPELGRVVFAICVLERYSIDDCTMLPSRPLRDINGARPRVGNQAGQFSELSHMPRRVAMP